MLPISPAGSKKTALSMTKFTLVHCCTEYNCPSGSVQSKIALPVYTTRSADHCCGEQTITFSNTTTADKQRCSTQYAQNAALRSAPAPVLQSARLCWRINGMDCASCARKVENAVRQVPGVEKVQVIFSTQKLLVNAVAHLRGQIEQAVQAAGYQLQRETQSRPAASHSLKDYAFIITLAVLIAASWGIAHFSITTGKLAFIVSTLIGLYPVAHKAWRLLRTGNWFAIESLMTIAVIGALVLGATAEASMVLLLFLLGEELEGWAASRARRGVSALMALTPETAIRLHNGQRTQVVASALQPGDIIEVAAGGRLPADGRLLAAVASFDESMLTGESLPVERHAGERVAAGVTSVDRLVSLEVLSRPGENAIDRIIRLIEDAEERRAPVERFIDQFSRIYTPLIIILAVLVAVVVPLLEGGGWLEWIYKALALLLIGCPCALVISTPAAITSGLAAAARMGALVKGGAALEQLSHIQQLAFDKTGTLTAGQPQVCSIQTCADLSENTLLILAGAVEQGSSHPLAQSIVSYARRRGLSLPDAQDQRTLAGIGIEAQVAGTIVRLSAPDRLPAALLTAEWRQSIRDAQQQGQTVIAVTRNDQLAGIITLRDTLRDDAGEALTRLQALQVQSIMLTGDNPRAAAAIAGELHMSWRAGLLPEDKVRLVHQLNSSAPLAMVGDGINDAPAMKAASLGIAMGNGSDVALETADIALTHSHLNVLPSLITLARATRRNVRQNISIALGLKLVFLITTLLGISGLWLAVLADTGATVLVTANALRLLAKRKH